MNTFKQKEREFALSRLMHLKEKFPESSQILSFMERILEFQNELLAELSEKGVYIDLSGAESRIRSGKPALNLSSVNFEPYLTYTDKLLAMVEEAGTEEMRKKAREVGETGREGVRELLSRFLRGEETDPVVRMLFTALLQPILYLSADRVSFNQEGWLRNTCPVCGSKPSVSFLMDTEEWEGARFLRCSLCLTDWLYVRTKCVECGNSEDDKLNYFVSGDINHIELQTCFLCNRYIKIVDMRKDGLAVPDLEDVATVSLDLWAEGEGYVKVERNLLGF